MNKSLLLVLIFICSTFYFKLSAKPITPDTVRIGIYITSIHDIDFKQKEYTINLWLWLKYKNKAFDFLQNLEIPQAKTFVQSYSTVDTTGGEIYLLMKLQCVMKDSWKINSFPFDRQKLRLSVENSQFDANLLVFKPDTAGKQYDPRFTINGWIMDSLKISTRVKVYETHFGDERLTSPHVEYSAFRVTIGLQREAMGLFWKMFLGMYVAFLIAFICFYIHGDSTESRFGLSVGSLFAVVGNKYVIDSTLPESSSFTLVDTLHGITLVLIFAIIASSVYSLNLVKKDKINAARAFDKISALIILVTYIILNIYFISRAADQS